MSYIPFGPIHFFTTIEMFMSSFFLYRMSLDRSELDNLQKSRAQRFYPSDFAVELEFEPAHTPPATVLTPGHTTEQHRTENQPSS